VLKARSAVQPYTFYQSNRKSPCVANAD